MVLGLMLYSCTCAAYYSYPNVSPRAINYSCDGLPVSSKSEPGKLYLQVSHYTYVLLLTRSEKGALYQNEVLSFLDHGPTATLVINDRVRNCTRISF